MNFIRWYVSVIALLLSISPFVVQAATYWGLVCICGLVDEP